jgi:hypothetical protein
MVLACALPRNRGHSSLCALIPVQLSSGWQLEGKQ